MYNKMKELFNYRKVWCQMLIIHI